MNLSQGRSSLLSITGMGLATAALALALVVFFRTEPLSDAVAYVRIDDVLANYNGVASVRALLEEKNASVQIELDTVRSDYRSTMATLNKEWRMMSAGERKRLEELASHQQASLSRRATVANEQIQEEQNAIMSGLMNQINEVLASYAKERGLDVVFGVSGDGAILYGSKALDITDEVTDALNRTYSSSATAQVAK